MAVNVIRFKLMCDYCKYVPAGQFCDGCGELIRRKSRWFGTWRSREMDDYPWEQDEHGKIWYWQHARIPSYIATDGRGH